MTDAYDRYIRAEWKLFSDNPARAEIIRQAVDGLAVDRVLDVGCGAGQELLPFLRDPRTFGIGLDLSPTAGVTATKLFAMEQPPRRVAFVRGAAEHLPFADSSFDVVVCRLTLPYTNNAEALAQIARVLRAGGALLLQFHHAWYYGTKLRRAIAGMNAKWAIHACRALLAGCFYHVTGRQPTGRVIGRETFQTMWLLRRELRRQGLQVEHVLSGPGRAAPLLLIRRSVAKGEGSV